jgi:hypothetical protein
MKTGKGEIIICKTPIISQTMKLHKKYIELLDSDIESLNFDDKAENSVGRTEVGN